jgi:hypothetical protein
VFHKVAKTAQLISLPDIYIKLKELMDDPDYTMAEVAILVGRDPGMATRFLRVVNSPLGRDEHAKVLATEFLLCRDDQTACPGMRNNGK